MTIIGKTLFSESYRKIIATSTKPKQTENANTEFHSNEVTAPPRVRVKDVIVPPHKQDLDHDAVIDIAESFAVSGGGPFTPIAVRRVEKDVAGDKGIKIVLVAGAHRLEAAKYAGLDYIDCVYIEGDDAAAKLIELGEDLWRKNLTVLRHAEMLTEWMALAEKKLRVSGQDVPKGKVGRPAGPLTRAAQELPAFGRSVEARRKELVRAKKIARISSEAKNAAIVGGLDNNQKALLEIAKASTGEAQVKKAVKISARLRDAVKGPKASEDGTGVRVLSEKQGADANNAVQGGADEPDRSVTSTMPIEATTIGALKTAWMKRGRELWKYAASPVRDEFIDMLKRARCHATIDVVKFIGDVFMGRSSIDCDELYAFAKTKGLAKAPVRKALNELSYSRKNRKGSGPRGRRYYKNNETDWKDQLPVFKDAEIKAAVAAAKEKQEPEQVFHQARPGDADYYNDI